MAAQLAPTGPKKRKELRQRPFTLLDEQEMTVSEEF
jgi:hypothetical protein